MEAEKISIILTEWLTVVGDVYACTSYCFKIFYCHL